MGKRLVQGAAAPVYLVDGDGNVIGEVNATTGMISGLPVLPATRSMLNPVQGTTAVLGTTIIIPAPGVGRRIVVQAFVIQNESATATTMTLRDGLAPAAGRFRCLGQNQGDGLAMVFPSSEPWKLSENNPLVMVLSGANSCGYSVHYYIEAV